MGGNTGNIRTLRNQSGTVGNRTLGSIIASDSGAGAGSFRRIYGYYAHKGIPLPYEQAFNIKRGQWAMLNGI